MLFRPGTWHRYPPLRARLAAAATRIPPGMAAPQHEAHELPLRIGRLQRAQRVRLMGADHSSRRIRELRSMHACFFLGLG